MRINIKLFTYKLFCSAHLSFTFSSLSSPHTPTPLVSECTHTPASFSVSLCVCVYSVDFLHQQHNSWWFLFMCGGGLLLLLHTMILLIMGRILLSNRWKNNNVEAKMDPRWLLIYLNPKTCVGNIEWVSEWVSEWLRVDLETHHRDDVGDTVSTVDDGARQRPLSYLSGRPGCC